MVIHKSFIGFLTFRILNVFLVRTWYHPDEYWQSLEVAHRMTFGYGYLTWEWTRGIRSYIHPLIIAAVYHVLYWFGLDNVTNLVLVPRILQATLSAFSDYCFYRWNKNNKWSAFLIITSWYWFHMATRTFINTLETCLSTIALRYYPRFSNRFSDSNNYLWFVAVMCFMRPTATILWLPLCINHIKNSKRSLFDILIKQYLLIGAVVGTIAIGIDSFARGHFFVAPFEFFKSNIWQDVASFFGSEPWHWYFTYALPYMLGPCTIVFLFAIVETIRYRENHPDQYMLLMCTFFAIIIYSGIGHKEARFILPLMPIFLHIITNALSKWSQKASSVHIWALALFILAGNAIAVYYNCWLHPRGPIDIMHSIADIAREYKDSNGNRASILFLVNAHSTPFYSHVHQNVSMELIPCEPNAENSHDLTEWHQFESNPSRWLKYNLKHYPSHIVLYDFYQQNITEFLAPYNLVKIHTFSFYDDKEDRKVLLLERAYNVTRLH